MEVLKYRVNAESPWQEIIALKGDKGDQGPQGDKGEQGEVGPAYTLTEEDKQAIVNAVIAALPSSEEVTY
mgnify:CR=1 FL=1